MSASRNIHLIEVPVTGNGGLVWNRLHSEREDICEAMLKASQLDSEGMSKDDDISTANWHRELLQARLRKIDDALDRLMSGSYGNCNKCSRWVQETKLDLDPAIAFCIECWERRQNPVPTGPLADGGRQISEPSISMPDALNRGDKINSSFPGVALETLVPFDTIFVRTLNSDYRILLLDSKTGRSLVEAGHHFVEPVEAVIYGSTSGGSTFKVGWIGLGLRMEMWVKDKLISTSPVQSVRVEHRSSAESSEALSSVQ